MLAEDYSETRQAEAITSTGNVLVVWANITTRSSTLTPTTPCGQTCMIGAGGDYQITPSSLPSTDPEA